MNKTFSLFGNNAVLNVSNSFKLFYVTFASRQNLWQQVADME